MKIIKKKLNEFKVSTLDNHKGFINLHFLQKINCQKTVWDQARFSSLVKRFVPTRPPHSPGVLGRPAGGGGRPAGGRGRHGGAGQQGAAGVGQGDAVWEGGVQGMCPLHWAVHRGHLDIVRTLLDRSECCLCPISGLLQPSPGEPSLTILAASS